MLAHLGRRRLRRFVAATALLGGLATFCLRERPHLAIIETPPGCLLRVEIADTASTRARGLSGRSVLAIDGMLLTFRQPGAHAIWMRDMSFPLDLLWLDTSGRVLALVQDAEPCRDAHDCHLHLPLSTDSAKHVLELAAGRAQAEGIVTGTRLKLRASRQTWLVSSF